MQTKTQGSKFSERRLIENEVIFRQVNRDVKEFLKEEDNTGVNEPVDFYCECSDPECTDRIQLTIKKYEELHKDKKRFITRPDHEFNEVENVISKEGDYQVVEKHFTPPKAEEINLALKSIQV